MNKLDKQIDLIGDAYENYCKEYWNLSFVIDEIEYGSSFYNHDTEDYTFEELSQEEFIDKVKTDEKFSKRWGIRIETRELSQRERCKLLYKSWEQNGISPEHKEVSTLWVEYNNLMKKYNIPTKLTTIKYNGQTQEIYE